MALIEQVISASDYYVVVVGGRYGSTTPEGISFTEKEFDYAAKLGKPILGFLHADPQSIPLGKSDRDAEAGVLLDDFRAKVKKRLIRYYHSPAELGSAVSRSLIKAIKTDPAEGWVRGGFALTPEKQAELADLKAEVLRLTADLARLSASQPSVPAEGLASGSKEYDLEGVVKFHKVDDSEKNYNRAVHRKRLVASTTWNSMFYDISAKMVNEASEPEIKDQLDRIFVIDVRDRISGLDKLVSYDVLDECLDDVLVQFFALGYIERGLRKRPVNDQQKYWALTQLGIDEMTKLRAIKSGDD